MGWDLLTLFVVCFGAATILPGSSEVVLYFMMQKGYSLLILFVTATLGNYLGSVVNFYIGRGAAASLASRTSQQGRYRVAVRWFARWGHLSLVLSWVPVIGDPLTVVAGMAGMPIARFSVWVALGKGGRYAILMLLSNYTGL